MRKKYLSALLFGALFMASTATFTSCKDYDDDIDNLQSQITANADAIKKLQDLVGAGKFVTNVTKVTDGITITWNDGSSTTLNGTDGKDGADGKDGVNGIDGKDGSVVTIGENNNWFIDGVDTGICAKGEKGDKGDKGEQGEQGPAGEDGAAAEAGKDGADGHDAAIIDGYWAVWNAETGAYVKTSFIAGGVRVVESPAGDCYIVTINKGDGTEESIKLPMSANMGTLTVVNADGVMKALYGINQKDVEYGPADNLKTFKAGLWTTLDRDLQFVANPEGTDASTYSYQLKNTVEDTELKFKTAVPFSGHLAARTTSKSGVWVLPHDYQRYDNNNLSDIRTNLYLKYKANDGARHALALSATKGESTINTPYDMQAKLEVIGNINVEIEDEQSIWNNFYTPKFKAAVEDSTAVYDYWVELAPGTNNEKKAIQYGLEFDADHHTFRLTKASGINNSLDFRYNYILIDGTVVKGNDASPFTVQFVEEMTTSVSKTYADFIAKFDANVLPAFNALPGVTGASLTTIAAVTDGQMFGMTKTYDLNEVMEGMNDTQKLIFLDAVRRKSFTATLIGGEGENNQNTAALNKCLLQNIGYAYDATTKALNITFMVSRDWEDNYDATTNALNAVEVANHNFKLNNAYELQLTVTDPDAGNEIAKINMPFELQQPTLDITHLDGNFTQWKGNTLYAYAPVTYANNRLQMYAPLYEAFDAWNAPTTDDPRKYATYKDNARYYDLNFQTMQHAVLFGKWDRTVGTDATVSLDNALNYNANFDQLNTWAAVNASPWDVYYVQAGEEVTAPMAVTYKHYGVYSAELDADQEQMDFDLVFASWLKHSDLKMKQSAYNTERGTHCVIITNDDLNFKTPKGDAFYLFDDIKADGTVLARAQKNGDAFNEIQQHPFTTFNNNSTIDAANGVYTTGLFDATDMHFTAKQADGTQLPVNVQIGATLVNANYNVNLQTGERSIKTSSLIADPNDIKVYMAPALATRTSSGTTTGLVNAIKGGMVIQLPNSIRDNESVIITVTLKDAWGYTQSFDIKVTKLN